jgi:UPF0716 protein FxsA
MRIPISLVLLLLLLAEIATFIWVGETIGVLATLGLILLGMIAGVMLLRRQGVATLTRVRAEMEAGRTPARPLAEGAATAIGALLIMLPGFLTDAAGLLLFVPPVRAAVIGAIGRRARVAASARATRPAPGQVIELGRSEYGTTPRRDSPWRQDDGPEA